MPYQSSKLGHRNTLGGNRHHHPGQARPRFPQLERMHRLAPRPDLRCQLLQASIAAYPHRILTKGGAEHRIHQQALDQAADASQLVSG
jgi:hypothetical protein